MKQSADGYAADPGGPLGQIRDFDVQADREAIVACVAGLQDFERTLDPELPPGAPLAPRYVDAMLQRCRAYRGRILVAEEGGRVVGFMCVLGQVPEAQAGRSRSHAMVGELYLDPAYRSHGIGTRLLAAAEAHARACGARRLRVQVLAGNAVARSLYLGAGFSERLVELEKPLD